MSKAISLIFVLCTCQVMGQCVNSEGVPFDSIPNPYLKNWKMVLALDARYCSALYQRTPLTGIKIGVKFKNKHVFGVGFYNFKHDAILYNKDPGYSDSNADSDLHFKFSYLTMYYEYIWIEKMRWELSTPVHLGTAILEMYYTDTANMLKPIDTLRFPLMEFSVVGQYNIFRWIGVKSGVGYRMLLVKNKQASGALNSIIIKFGAAIRLGELWKMVNKKKYKEYDEYWKLYKCNQKNKRTGS